MERISSIVPLFNWLICGYAPAGFDSQRRCGPLPCFSAWAERLCWHRFPGPGLRSRWFGADISTSINRLRKNSLIGPQRASAVEQFAEKRGLSQSSQKSTVLSPHPIRFVFSRLDVITLLSTRYCHDAMFRAEHLAFLAGLWKEPQSLERARLIAAP